jgi:hypothetical protein
VLKEFPDTAGGILTMTGFLLAQADNKISGTQIRIRFMA